LIIKAIRKFLIVISYLYILMEYREKNDILQGFNYEKILFGQFIHFGSACGS